MQNKNFEEENSLNNSVICKLQKQQDNFIKKINYKIFIFLILVCVNNIVISIIFSFKRDKQINKKETMKIERLVYNNSVNISHFDYLQIQYMKEKMRPYLQDINAKRIFEKRLPLKKEINCKPHFSQRELIGFLSFLTNNTIFFETGSGCSSLIAKFYTKKSYAIEGCRQWYEQGIKNGLKDNLIFHDLKPDNPIWSYPGKESNINDWKTYFQCYDKSYNADVILIDGRFKIATAMDIFDKIRNDTVVLLHEYQDRPDYFILEKYYRYIYHWDTLVAFIKKDVKSIPLDVQKKYWNHFL